MASPYRFWIGLALMLSLAASARAQQVMAPTEDAAHLQARLSAHWAMPGQPMPADQAELDQMVKEKRFVDLTKRLQSANTIDTVHLDLNWEQARLFDGAGFIIALGYMHDLWREGISLPPPNGDQLKRSAGAMMLYTLALIEIDGPQCGDRTAPGHRMDQLAQQGQPIFAFVKTLPRDERMKLGAAALTVEAATAPVRGQDDVLCRDGMEEMNANLKAWGDKPLPTIPCPPGGSVGVCRGVPEDPNYRPQFLSPAAWKPKQAQMRSQMPGLLTRLLSLPGETTTTTPPAAAPKG